MPFIISDVTCLMKKDTLAKAGDQVTVISDFGNVVICEHNGNRFSVKKDNLTNEKREGETIPISEQKNTSRWGKVKVKVNKPELF